MKVLVQNGYKNFSNARMVSAAMVPKGTTNEYLGANFTPKNRKLIAEPRHPKSRSDGKQNLTVHGMGSFRKKLVAVGLSEKFVSLISDSRRKGTINHYESAWRKWDSWCREQACDPFCCSLNTVLKLLTDLFHKEPVYNNICNNRPAVSAYHEPIGPFSVGKHPRANDLMTKIFNNRIPQPKYCLLWDFEKESLIF